MLDDLAYYATQIQDFPPLVAFIAVVMIFALFIFFGRAKKTNNKESLRWLYPVLGFLCFIVILALLSQYLNLRYSQKPLQSKITELQSEVSKLQNSINEHQQVIAEKEQIISRKGFDDENLQNQIEKLKRQLERPYQKIYTFDKKGYAVIEKNTLENTVFGFVDKYGNETLLPEYKEITAFSEGYAGVMNEDGLWDT